MKIFVENIDVEGRDAVRVYTEDCRDGIYVLWDELEEGTLTLADAKARVVEMSEGEY